MNFLKKCVRLLPRTILLNKELTQKSNMSVLALAYLAVINSYKSVMLQFSE